MTSRLEGDQLDAEWRKSCGNTPFATIDLGPLGEEDALSLAADLINTTHSLALACIERAGGNPLFLEQLLRNAQEGSQQAVPASIQSLVLARMDRLTARDREAFQVAAIIGQRFELALLRRLINVPNYTCEKSHKKRPSASGGQRLSLCPCSHPGGSLLINAAVASPRAAR